MKRLILIGLLLCPFAISAESKDQSISQTWHEINSYRVTSAAKAVIQTFLAAYAFKHGWRNGRLFMDDGSVILRWPS